MSAGELALAAGCAALAAAPMSVTGFGLALVLAPLLLLVLDPGDVVAATNALSMLTAAGVAWRWRARIAWSTARPLFLAALAGMPVGLALLLVANARVLEALIGAAVLGGTVALARGFRIGRGATAALAAGALSGVLRTSTSAAGPPVMIYLQGRGLPPEAFRATGACYIAATGLAAVGLLAGTGRFSADAGLTVLAGLPGLVVGSLAGAALARRVNATWFRRAVTALLLASAVSVLIAAVAG